MEAFTRANGYPPTVREICKATGLRSPRSVSQHLQALERKGYIQRGRDKSRAIRFLHKSVTGDATVALPVRGRVSAGRPVTATDDGETTLLVDRRLAGDDGSFLMQVEGDSMIDAHIVEGDYIVVSPDREARGGDVVVASVGDETVVKRYEEREDGVHLVPQNSGMSPLDLSSRAKEVKILGRVVGLIRTIR
jgi:repressor LexA